MTQRVIDFRIDRVEISHTDYWALPERARELIRVYGRECFDGRPGVLTFEMGIERWDEINAALRVLAR